MATAHEFLSADSLFKLIRAGFEQVPDQRAENAKISLPDALMSGFAVFSVRWMLVLQQALYSSRQGRQLSF